MERPVAPPLVCPRRRAEGGVALLAVILLGTAVAVMAHAGLMIGFAMQTAARAAARATEYDARAKALLHRTAADMVTLDASLPAGVAGRRLSGELLRIRVDSAGRGWTGLLWTLDPRVRLAALVAPIRVGVPMSEEAREQIAAPPDTSCADGWTMSPFPIVDTGEWLAEDPLAFGPLLDHDRAGFWEPRAGGTDRAEAMSSSESLVLGAGSWTGLLLVNGSLELRAGAIVSGWVGVRGDLRVHAGAEVEGVVRVGRRLNIDAGGGVAPNPCAALQHLMTIDELTVPRLVAGSIWPADPAG